MWRRRMIVWAPEGEGAGGAGGAGGTGEGDGGDGGGGAGGAGAGAGGGTAGNGQAGAAVFGAELSEGHRQYLRSHDIKDLGNLVDGHKALSSSIGEKRLVVPKDFGDVEARGQFFDQIGRPESADAYEFKAANGADFTDMDKAFQTAMRPVLHDAGILPVQLEAINEGWNKFTSEHAANFAREQKETHDAGMAALREEWGDRANARIEVADTASQKLCSAELLTKLEKAHVLNDPAWIKIMAQVGAAMTPDGKLVEGDRAGDMLGMTAEQAQGEKQKLKDDEGFMKVFGDKTHKDYKAAVARMRSLNEIIDGGA